MTEWAEIAQTRQGLYRFFGGALLAPSPDQFDLLGRAREVLDERDLDRFAFSRDWRRLGRHFPVDVVASGMDVEFVRLLASGMSDALSPPTESYYRVPGRGGGIGEFVADLQREYGEMGMRAVGFGEAPDHLSTELDVMSHLCGREVEAWVAGEARQAGEVVQLESRFLKRHLAIWVPMFWERVVAARPQAIYQDLATAIHAFVVHDNDYVSAIREGLAEA